MHIGFSKYSLSVFILLNTALQHLFLFANTDRYHLLLVNTNRRDLFLVNMYNVYQRLFMANTVDRNHIINNITLMREFVDISYIVNKSFYILWYT